MAGIHRLLLAAAALVHVCHAGGGGGLRLAQPDKTSLKVIDEFITEYETRLPAVKRDTESR
jgi:hypothetical protein